MRDEWFTDPTGHRPEAWFVPQDVLRPMSELEVGRGLGDHAGSAGRRA
jgi:hypothetical protein